MTGWPCATGTGWVYASSRSVCSLPCPRFCDPDRTHTPSVCPRQRAKEAGLSTSVDLILNAGESSPDWETSPAQLCLHETDHQRSCPMSCRGDQDGGAGGQGELPTPMDDEAELADALLRGYCGTRFRTLRASPRRTAPRDVHRPSMGTPPPITWPNKGLGLVG